MVELAMRTCSPSAPLLAKPFDLEAIKRQTRALERIAEQLKAVPKPNLLLELQPKYVLAKRRLLEEPV